VRLDYQSFDLPLRHVFTIARGSTAVQPTLIVQLSVGDVHGYGEATTNSYYGATIANLSASLESVRSQVEGALLDDPLDLIAALARRLPKQEFALSALDQAIHDLWGKLRGAPVHRLWGLSVDDLPRSDYTIGLDTPAAMVAKLLEMPDWPIYKIKLGSENDLEIVRQLRQHTDAVFRVDANCGWTAHETVALSHELQRLDVEFIEQPMPPGDDAAARWVFERSALPLVADESCATEADVDRCIGSFHGINIKLVKCGGLAAARRMIERARALGLRVMLGCMTESSVGISALAQLLPLVDFADMDGAVLLARDVATGVRLDRGQCIFPAENGTGARLLGGPIANSAVTGDTAESFPASPQ
jgi:L-alanine-DL-glutamate epimerase-like enolase superfamily enzyme